MTEKLKPMSREAYNALDDNGRKLVDHVRETFAKEAAKATKMPFNEVLQSIIALHERGHLAMVMQGDDLTLVPCLDCEVFPGAGWNWDK